MHSQDTENPVDTQHIASPTFMPTLPSIFFRQPLYSHGSIKCFLKHTYNHSKYGQNFLSLNFSHVATFLSYSSQSELPRDYIGRVLGLFGQKLKGTMYINSYAFCELLDQLPGLVKTYFCAEQEKAKRIKCIKECVYNYLLTEFKTLKENPDHALQDLSERIYDVSTDKPYAQETDTSISKLQNITMHFLEISLNKLIWSPSDQQDIWLCVKDIAYSLEQLLVHNIIPDAEILDELYWSLIHRFCYILELSGAELSDETFNIINNDLITQKSNLWCLHERESFITSKLDHLQRAVMQAQIKSRAYQAGIIADTLSHAVPGTA
jgi:hypothetical protein